MATYFVSASGSNTAPYDTWAKAATSLATALAAASSAGDIVALDAAAPPSGDAELAADTIYTFAATNVSLICSTNSGTSTITPTTMGTGTWIGNRTVNRAVSFAAPARSVYIYGITIRVSGTTGDSMWLVGGTNTAGAGGQIEYENSYFWLGNTNASQIIGVGNVDAPVCCIAKGCTFRFGATGQAIGVSGRLILIGGSVSSAGSIPTTGLFRASQVQDPGGGDVEAEGFDMTALGSNPIAANSTTSVGSVLLTRCKLGAGFTVLASLTNPNLSNVEVYLNDCAVGDTHGTFGYYNAMGSCVTDSTITYNSQAWSWKIVTTANANFAAPFRSPFIDWHNTGTSAVTPKIEILRDGSTTAYTDAQVWGEFSAKTSTGVVTATLYTDRQELADYAAGTAGTSQATGSGLGSWAGESGTAWSGKVDSGSAITPAEVGEIRGRIAVAAPNITVYASTQIEV